MNDIKVAKALNLQSPVQVIDARTVKIQRVGNLQTFMNQNIDFGSLRQAVMINETLLVGANMPQLRHVKAPRQ